MNKYILGYNDSMDEFLTEYDSVSNAEFNSEEWCTVFADTLEDAKDKYEKSFLSWKESN